MIIIKNINIALKSFLDDGLKQAINTQTLIKLLLFVNWELGCYNFIWMKGSLYANPTFIRKNIRQPTVISTKPLVAYDQTRLYFNNLSVKWQAKDIVNCTYSHEYKVLLVLSDDCKIHVLTQQLEVITQLNGWQSKYIVGFQLIEELNQMLLVGTTEIEVIKVTVLSNVKRTKFLSSMKFSLKKQAHLGVEPHNKLKWNKGYGYVLSEDLLYIWSLQDVYFYSLHKLTIRTKAIGITKKEHSITTVYFSNHSKYTIGGLMNGQIKVWRLAINPLFNHKEILIHSFAYHSKEVEQIIQGEDQNNIISLGFDLNVCFMSIDTFQLLRIFNFVGEYSKIYLYDHLMAFAIKDSFLGELSYGKKLQFISELTGVPINYDDTQIQHENTSKSSSVLMTLSSNLGIQLKLNQLQSTKQLNKIELIHIYPPLKSKNIAQIITCPFKEDSYYMLVEDGDIFHARLQNRAGKIDEHYIISKINDVEKHQLHQTATYISFLKLIPPRIDTQIIERVADSKFNRKEEPSEELELLAIGCNRGSIIFVSVNDMDNIYARVTFHRQKIVYFQEIRNKQTNQQWICSHCEQHYLRIICFHGGRASCLYTIYFGDISVRLYGFDQYLALVFDKGIFQVAQFIEYNKQPLIIVNKQSINHEDDIVSINYSKDLKLILTGGKDNKIKIWTTCKVLIYEIILDEMLQYCSWVGTKHVLLIQNNFLGCLRNISLKISQKEVLQYNKTFQDSYFFEDEFTISQYVEQALMKLKERIFKIRSIRNRSLQNSPSTSLAKKQAELATTTRKREYKSFNKSAILSERTPLKTKRKIFKTEQSQETLDKIRKENEHEAVRKHLEQMAELKKEANKCNFPKVKTKHEDIFVEFMRQKLLNKKLLTRRDITLNRIILKNLIKDHIKGDGERQELQSVKIQ